MGKQFATHGNNMGDANISDDTNLRIPAAGGGVKRGQRITFKRDNNTPICNLFVNTMQRAGKWKRPYSPAAPAA